MTNINATYASITEQKTSLTTDLVADQAALAKAHADAQAAADAGAAENATTATKTATETTKAQGIASDNAAGIGIASADAKTASESVVTSKDTALQAATDMVGGVKTTVDDANGDLQGAGTAVDSAVATGVANGSGEIQTAVVNTVKSATGGLSGGGAASAAKTGGYSIGMYLAKGIASGINANSYLIQKAVSQAIKDALKAAHTEGEIKSPSKLFRDEVGRYLAEGVGVGFTGTMKKVNGDMAKSLASGMETVRGIKERTLWSGSPSNETYTTSHVDARQYITFESTMQAPDEVARAVRKANRYGLAGANL